LRFFKTFGAFRLVLFVDHDRMFDSAPVDVVTVSGDRYDAAVEDVIDTCEAA
jgi:hypothetical protein